jgi:hypothetical protein
VSGGLDELLATALLGTARRRPPQPGGGGDELDRVLAATAQRAPEGALLAAAGALAVFGRAGERAPAATHDPLPPSPPDDRALAHAAAVAFLDAMLGGEHDEALEEWLTLAADRGLRPPPGTIPALLDFATEHSEARDAVALGAGPRGRWLAEANPRWRWLLGAPKPADGEDDRGEALAEAWRTGTRDERRALLDGVRASEPARGRELLAATWEDEDPRDRPALLGALEAGLSLDDEPFLEQTALADRRKPVRREAARLLTALPGSRLAQRVAAHAAPLLAVEGGLRKRLAVHPPDALDPQLEQDGIERKPPRGRGERSWWAEQLLAAAPLATWTETLGREPAELAGLSIERGWEEEVRAGWAEAAARQRDRAWAQALAPLVADPRLLALVPAADRERLAADALGRDVHAGVPLDPEPWGDALSRAAVRALAQAVQEGIEVRPWIARLRPERLGDAQRALEPLAASATWQNRTAVRALGLTVFRRELLAAFDAA